MRAEERRARSPRPPPRASDASGPGGGFYDSNAYREKAMKSFTDNTGRAWTLVVNVATIKRVRALCGVDLNSIVEVEDGKPSAKLLERLSGDPVLLVDVLYAVCKPECDQRGVSDEDFGAAMAGDSVEAATDALLDEVIDFFPETKRRAFRKILSASRRFGEAAKRRLAELLEDGKFEDALVSELERLTGLSPSAPESAESTPTPSN